MAKLADSTDDEGAAMPRTWRGWLVAWVLWTVLTATGEVIGRYFPDQI